MPERVPRDREKNMDTNLVQNLLNGSENIDRFNKEIKQVLHLLFWLTKSEEIHSKMFAFQEEELEYTSLLHWWRVRKSGEKAFDLTLSIMYEQRGTCRNFKRIYTTKSHILKPPQLEYVQNVWEALPLIVEGFEEDFPELKERWKPFLGAAQLGS
jgi:hypothetical protein